MEMTTPVFTVSRPAAAAVLDGTSSSKGAADDNVRMQFVMERKLGGALGGWCHATPILNERMAGKAA